MDQISEHFLIYTGDTSENETYERVVRNVV